MLPSHQQVFQGEGLPSHSPVKAALPVYLRLLVSNVAAGCIIGRKAVEALLECVMSSGAPSQTMLARDGTSVVIRMLVPSALVGSIIGAGGATMQDLRTTTGAAITVSPLRKNPPVPPDRVVTIVGAKEALVQAIGLMLVCLRDNDKYDLYTPQRLPDADGADGTMASGSSATPSSMLVMQPYPNQPAPVGMPSHHPTMTLVSPTNLAPALGAVYPTHVPPVPQHDASSNGLGMPGIVESTFAVPDARVGAIIGRRGEIIVKVQQLLGVKIFVSSRSEQPTADSERTVTVTGPPDAVQLAEALLQQKLRAWNAPGGGTNNPSGSGGGAADDGLF